MQKATSSRNVSSDVRISLEDVLEAATRGGVVRNSELAREVVSHTGNVVDLIPGKSLNSLVSFYLCNE